MAWQSCLDQIDDGCTGLKASILVARILLWLIPALAAGAALLASMVWIPGIPGDPKAPYAEGWWLGLLALLGYLAAYGFFLIVWLAGRVMKLAPITSLAHGFIWIALGIALVTQYLAWEKMLAS